MRKIILSALFLSLAFGADVRHFFDNVGYCTKPYQIEAIVKAATAKEASLLKKEKTRGYIAVISPHDDHMFAGRVYVHAIAKIASARTVVIFSVTHGNVRRAIGDPEDVLIFDDYSRWQAPYTPVPVDISLRTYLENHLDRADYMVSRKAHSLEHAAEAMVPFLQFYNRKVRILAIMVTRMNWWRLRALSEKLASVLNSYMRENHLKLGKDIAFIISTDATHYGPDFNYEPFGLDEKAHEMATAQDKELGEKYLSGNISEDKIRLFADRLWGEKIPWCGVYSVPFGVMTVLNLAKLQGKTLYGVPLRYGDSYSLGVLPVFKKGIGITAPFSLKHWVGYWAIGYRLK